MVIKDITCDELLSELSAAYDDDCPHEDEFTARQFAELKGISVRQADCWLRGRDDLESRSVLVEAHWTKVWRRK